MSCHFIWAKSFNYNKNTNNFGKSTTNTKYICICNALCSMQLLVNFIRTNFWSKSWYKCILLNKSMLCKHFHFVKTVKVALKLWIRQIIHFINRQMIQISQTLDNEMTNESFSNKKCILLLHTHSYKTQANQIEIIRRLIQNRILFSRFSRNAGEERQTRSTQTKKKHIHHFRLLKTDGNNAEIWQRVLWTEN